jgi:hypothetical protein
LQGWRWDVFGKSAIALKNGEIALSAHGRHLRLIKIEKAKVLEEEGEHAPGVVPPEQEEAPTPKKQKRRFRFR